MYSSCNLQQKIKESRRWPFILFFIYKHQTNHIDLQFTNLWLFLHVKIHRDI